MADWPTFADKDHIGRIGVNLVALKVHKLLGWTFRETSSSDIGIDGEIEIRENDNTSHGRLISVQVKCGRSFFREQTPTGYIFRGSYKHLHYWTERLTPVIVILCNPENDTCYWQKVDLKNVRLHNKGWSIEVSVTNELSAISKEALESVASKFQKKDVVELLLRDWLGWSFEHRIRFASIYAIPRDYHWLSFLAAIEEEFIMADYVMSDFEGFDEAVIREMHHWAGYNQRNYGYQRFILAFIAESQELLQCIPDPLPISGVTVEYIPLLLDLSGPPTLLEIGKDGQVIEFYEHGKTLDGFMESVERNIKQALP